ncbi:MAG: sigma-70 family RNA polymerase sigma factor [Actinobacteria bacterium]|nr:sigma-70 family RNA polymerase sigma factor [Actinomycetota bacterium]
MTAYAADARGLPCVRTAATMSVLSYSDVNDSDLIQLVGSGDRSAFEALYGRYARPVFGLALRRLGDRGRAEDAVQETFASVWRAARTYRPERGLGSPWLYAVARNAIVDNGRARREPPVDAPDEVAGEAGPADRAEAAWIAWRVHRALSELPDGERQVIELAYWGGRSQSEIADLLKIPLGTVKTRTRSGLSRLSAMLDDVL